jgi:ubiquinone/menaquinone biosynthesis C-methylase UbiE
MTTSQPTPRMPDYERMAVNFDAVLPFVQRVAEAIVERLPELRGGTVVDIACGTGEPGLTLARRNPHVHVLGVDRAPAMIEIACRKAALEPVPNAEFSVMPAENVDVPDAGAAAVISRFGLLAFGDPYRSAAELARILEPGGSFSIAAWHDVTLNTLPYTAFLTLRSHLPDELLPPFDHPDARAADTREQILREAGLSALRTEEFRWTYDFPDFPAVWRFVTGPAMLGPSFDALHSSVEQEVRFQLSERLSDHRDPDGTYRIPHTCRLYTGRHTGG